MNSANQKSGDSNSPNQMPDISSMAVQPNQSRAGKPAANQIMPGQFFSVFSGYVQLQMIKIFPILLEKIPEQAVSLGVFKRRRTHS